MMSAMRPAAMPSRDHAPKAPTSTTTLLYWLLVICGLAGLTMQRLDTLGEVLPLWVGTIAGVAFGQLVAWARIRLWVLWALGMLAFWISPLFLILFYSSSFLGTDPVVRQRPGPGTSTPSRRSSRLSARPAASRLACGPVS